VGGLSLATEQASYHLTLRHQHHLDLAGSFDFVSGMASQGWQREIQRVLGGNFEGYSATDGESWEHRLALLGPQPGFDAAFSVLGASPSMMFRSFRLCVGSLIVG
jgi:hypothetical protein